MSLRLRLVLAFALASSLPLLAGAWLWQRRLDPVVDMLKQERVARVGAALTGEAIRLAEATRDGVALVRNELAGGAALDALARGRGDELDRVLRGLPARHGLDDLVIIDERSRTIRAHAAGIERGLPAAEWAEAETGGAVWQPRAEGARILAAGALNLPDGSRFRVVGARNVGSEELDQAGEIAGTPVAVVAASSPAPSGAAAASSDLRGAGGRSALRLVARVDTSGEEALGRSLRRATLLTGLAGLLAAGLAGAWLAGRVTAPVSRLTRAMEGVATGELDLSLRVEREDLGRLSDAFQRMIAALARSRRDALDAERRAAWRDAARRVAHEVKNPLTPIRAAVENLRRARERGEPVLAEVFEVETATVLEEVERLRKMVDEFSRFARMPEARIEPTDLGALVRSVARRRVPDGGPVRLSLHVNGLPPVPCDADQVAGALENLVRNSVEAMAPKGGRLEVTAGVVTAEGRSFAQVVVHDEGPGIPEEDRSKVFEPYFTTKRRLGGTGLGLAVALQVARDHGGSLTVADAPGRGAAFRLRLPLSSSAARRAEP